MTIYDISIPVTEDLAVWPGDTPFSFHLDMKIQNGEAVNVGAITLSVHTGTHADAPFHFSDSAASIEALSLEPYLGPALVVPAIRQDPIGPETFVGLDLSRTPRVLIKTGAWTDHRVFPQAVPTLTHAAVTLLAERGAILVGVDVPSVDEIDSKTLPIHHALNDAGIRILESLNLSEVPAGEYELIALPQRIVGADGSPVRAILRQRTVE
ncbi:MAG: arylformamidase [Cytophagales bacterium]|nr:arylformamidase [Armatimonadota bacterium]